MRRLSKIALLSALLALVGFSVPSRKVVPLLDRSERMGEGGTVAVYSRPEGAVVYIDDRYVGRTPLEVKVSRGQHRLHLALYGYKSVTEHFNNGQTGRLVFSPILFPMPSELRLALTGADDFTNASVQDLLGDGNMGPEAFERLGGGLFRVVLRPGNWRVNIYATGKKPASVDFTMAGGEVKDLNLPLASAIKKWMEVESFGANGDGDGQLNLPQGIASSGNQMVVADSGNARLTVWTTDGKWVQSVKFEGERAFAFPVGVAFAPTPVVSDQRKNRLVFLTSDFSFDSVTSPNEPYRVPMGIAGRVGKVAMADSENQTIRILQDEVLSASFSNLGLQNPGDVKWTDDGQLLISDWGNQRIVLASADGTLVSERKMEFSPGQISLDASGNVYVPNGPGHEIQVFDSTLAPKATIALKGTPYPAAVLWLGGRLFVTARDAGKVLILEERVPD
jgi:hypothetical protein